MTVRCKRPARWYAVRFGGRGDSPALPLQAPMRRHRYRRAVWRLMVWRVAAMKAKGRMDDDREGGWRGRRRAW